MELTRLLTAHLSTVAPNSNSEAGRNFSRNASTWPSRLCSGLSSGLAQKGNIFWSAVRNLKTVSHFLYMFSSCKPPTHTCQHNYTTYTLSQHHKTNKHLLLCVHYEVHDRVDGGICHGEPVEGEEDVLDCGVGLNLLQITHRIHRHIAYSSQDFHFTTLLL